MHSIALGLIKSVLLCYMATQGTTRSQMFFFAFNVPLYYNL